MKVATFTGELNDPSSRYRIRQHIDKLRNFGIEIDDYSSKNGKYPPLEKEKRIIWGAKVLTERLSQVTTANIKGYDCSILQREMISTLNTFERYTPRPRILDVDDAIYLHKRGNFIKNISKYSDTIICGNNNLAEIFSKWSSNIFVVPTAVDTKRYIPGPCDITKDKITIGWVGTSGGFQYIYQIEKALNYILLNNNEVELLIVSDSKPKFSEINNYRYVKWNEHIEIESFQQIDIGIMPLKDDEWSRGKCSYKMLLYMACGTPVVVSPVGMNNDVLGKGYIGFGAKDYYSDWIESITYLVKNEKARHKMSTEGRAIVLDNYSVDIISKKIGSIITRTIK